MCLATDTLGAGATVLSSYSTAPPTSKNTAGAESNTNATAAASGEVFRLEIHSSKQNPVAEPILQTAREGSPARPTCKCGVGIDGTSYYASKRSAGISTQT